MNILLIGKNGQLATELSFLLPILGNVLCVGKNEININSLSNINDICKNFQPNLIINTAAYTNVDGAESNLEDAWNVNVQGVDNLISVSNELEVPLIHYSTDYVFDGLKKTHWTESDECFPINIYGTTKRIGEVLIESKCKNYWIFRTSWLYGLHGKNFYKTILNLAKTKNEINVINDQIGSPTSSYYVALATLQVLSQGIKNINNFINQTKGIYHLSAAKECSWFEFALNIAKLNNFEEKIKEISSVEYASIAKRPSYSVLSNEKFFDTFGFCLPNWKDQLSLINKLNK